MRKVTAVTHHNPKFLKEAYRMDSFINLVNTQGHVKKGAKYIEFEPETQRFCVWKKTEPPTLIGKFEHIMSAMFRAK